MAIRTSFERAGGPPDQLSFGSGLRLVPRRISRPALLASVAGSWQGGRRSGRHQPENLHPGCSWGGFSPGVEEPGGVGGVSASWGGLSFVVLIIRGIQPRRGGCF